MPAIGFDNQKYLTTQSEQIKKRIAQFGGKLYLEFGGKLFDDYHASRVLPGFEPDSKIRMLEQLKDKAEIIIAINAGDIEKNKVRGDLGITYDSDVLRLIDIFRSRGLPVGGVEQIRVGKKYTHNDICFPCQMVIGELIDALQKGNYPEDSVAVGMAKLSCDCRMANYTAILRKALDSAGFENVPILTTDPGDTKGIHPGVSMLGARSVLLAAWAFSMLDILEELCRKIRPYETAAGETNRVFSECVEWIAAASKQGLGKMIGAFRRAIEAFRGLRYDRSRRKPRVLVTGELLVNFHPGTNFHVEEYLERNDMEVILPRITYQFRKDFQAAISEIRDFGAHLAPYPFALDGAVEFIQRFLERIARSHPLYHPAARPQDLYSDVEHFIPKTLTCGEGWLMAGEIAHYAHQGVRSFIILQPFGCLPNHVCGRGVTKRLKEEFPGVQILPLDLDPDTSYANVENRLQMLIMNQTAEAEHSAASVEPAPQKTRGGSPRPALSST